MEAIIDAVATLVRQVSPEKVRAIAARIRDVGPDKAPMVLAGVVGTPAGSSSLTQLLEAWASTDATSNELALMLLTASHVHAKNTAAQSTELVWTGPTTPYVSARRTEQALLQVINSAKHTLFVTSFVAYEVSSIVKGLNAANDRGVAISMLLELSEEHGGSISFDAISQMKALVPAAKLYAWRDKGESFTNGRVHAKVAVADDHTCFITSANLTGFAMERNMEAGLLHTGGHIPRLLGEHLRALVDTRIVSPV
ncbi:MAG: phospholipase [Haliea sp.]|nr:phospholipase [Haliea sp.]